MYVLAQVAAVSSGFSGTPGTGRRFRFWETCAWSSRVKLTRGLLQGTHRIYECLCSCPGEKVQLKTCRFLNGCLAGILLHSEVFQSEPQPSPSVIVGRNYSLSCVDPQRLNLYAFRGIFTSLYFLFFFAVSVEGIAREWKGRNYGRNYATENRIANVLKQIIHPNKAGRVLLFSVLIL